MPGGPRIVRVAQVASALGCSGGGGFGQAVAHELGAGGDAELGEYLPQVVIDGTRAEIQLRGDLAVGQALRDQPGDLQFLWCELVQGQAVALAGGFPGCPQLCCGAVLPRQRPELVEQLSRREQVSAGFLPPALSPQPLAVKQFGASAPERGQGRTCGKCLAGNARRRCPVQGAHATGCTARGVPRQAIVLPTADSGRIC